MRCQHNNVQDLVTFWKCTDCGKIARKKSIHERLDEIRQLQKELSALRDFSPSEVDSLKKRLDAIDLSYGLN